MTLNLRPDEIDRLARHAKAQLAAQVRFVDEHSTREHVIGLWIESLPDRDVPLPTPSAEPGDLLVKLARGEYWSFTTEGWLELAPVYRMGVGVDFGTDPPIVVPYVERQAGLRDDALKHLTTLLYVGDEHNQLRVAQAILDATWRPPAESHPESLDVDHDEIDLNRIIDEGGAVRKRAGHHWPPAEADHQDGMRRARQLAEEARDRILASDEPTLGDRGGARMSGLGSVRFTDVPGGMNLTPPPPSEPWEPSMRQQAILDELAEQADQLTATLETISKAPFDLDGGRMELAAYRAGINRARLLVRHAMRRLYGPESIG
jgi:hypothetical protein